MYCINSLLSQLVTVNAINSHFDVDINIKNAFKHYLSENQDFTAHNKGRILATGEHDKSWYFDNKASYLITFDLADFQGASFIKCEHPKDNITLADGSTILPDGMSTVSFLFFVNRNTERISLYGVCYCLKLDTKLISFSMLDRKGPKYSSQNEILSVWDISSTIIVSRLTPSNLYKVDLSEAANKINPQLAPTKIDCSRAMTAGISKLVMDLFT